MSAFDDLPEADRAAVLMELMKTVTRFTVDESFLTAQLTKERARKGRKDEFEMEKYYQERLTESLRMAVVWRAAVAKLQGVG